MGAQQSIPGIDDTITYSLKLYETVSPDLLHVNRSVPSKHVATLAHPTSDEFWLLNPEGERIVQLQPKEYSTKDTCYVDFDSECLELRTLRRASMSYSYALIHKSGGYWNHLSIVHYYSKDVTAILEKARAKQVNAASEVPGSYKID